MAGGTTSGTLSRKDLERLLEQTLVPVEPEAAFAERLRARLVAIQGSARPAAWLVWVVGGATLVLVMTVLGLLLRIVLALVGLLQVAEGLRSERSSRA